MPPFSSSYGSLRYSLFRFLLGNASVIECSREEEKEHL